jgi:hypothetical protein
MEPERSSLPCSQDPASGPVNSLKPQLFETCRNILPPFLFSYFVFQLSLSIWSVRDMEKLRKLEFVCVYPTLSYVPGSGYFIIRKRSRFSVSSWLLRTFSPFFSNILF